jgi:hypothetical protein
MRRLPLVVLLCLPPTVTPAQETTARVIANAPIYIHPKVLPTPLRVIATGTRLKVVKVEGDWARVEFHDPSFGQRVGWVQRRLVKIDIPDHEPTDASATERTAPSQPASKPSEVAAASVPDRLIHAKSALVVNAGVRLEVFDKFQAELQKWNRFRLVQRKEDADITILLSSTSGELFGGGSESKFYVRISDAKDGSPLWADMIETAGSVSGSGKRLVSNLRKEMDEK